MDAKCTPVLVFYARQSNACHAESYALWMPKEGHPVAPPMAAVQSMLTALMDLVSKLYRQYTLVTTKKSKLDLQVGELRKAEEQLHLDQTQILCVQMLFEALEKSIGTTS